ncbi:MAG: histidinol-phosphate transaminase [Muribaculum sp.]|nr:histidinol-phosphate transaminase [Muribaculum sp.]
MMTLNELVRPNILNLTPYTCARNEYTGEAKAWLDANENSRIEGLNRYPDPLQTEVKKLLGTVKHVDPERIFLGVGSDECIDLCYRVFCRPGTDNVVAIDPTYGMYSVCAEINDVEYRPVKLNDDFSINVDRLLAATDKNTKVIWICSPNNPTGNSYDLDTLREIVMRFGGITVVDEAYVDFSERGTMLKYLDEFPRLIVMQTFSKAWASAAMRLGVAYASKEIIGIFNNVKYPYNINILTQNEAIKILRGHKRVAEVATELVEARKDLAKSLSELKCVVRVYPSDANFLLVRVNDADGLYDRLKSEGVIVRNRSRVSLCGGCLRITVGSDKENELLIEKIREYGI